MHIIFNTMQLYSSGLSKVKFHFPCSPLCLPFLIAVTKSTVSYSAEEAMVLLRWLPIYKPFPKAPLHLLSWGKEKKFAVKALLWIITTADTLLFNKPSAFGSAEVLFGHFCMGCQSLLTPASSFCTHSYFIAFVHIWVCARVPTSQTYSNILWYEKNKSNKAKSSIIQAEKRKAGWKRKAEARKLGKHTNVFLFLNTKCESCFEKHRNQKHSLTSWKTRRRCIYTKTRMTTKLPQSEQDTKDVSIVS